MTRRSQGFTLIELLVVIGIIAVLAAILFPVFISAKERGRDTTCKSNMKQIAVGLLQYADDWNGRFPDQTSVGIAYTGSYADSLGRSWNQQFAHRYQDSSERPAGLAKVVRPYLKSNKIWKCPSEPKNIPSGYITLYYIPQYKQRSSYFYKMALCFYANYYKRPVSASEASFPSKATLLIESGAWHSGARNPYLWTDDPSNPPQPPKNTNAIYLDGHVAITSVPYHTSSGFDTNWYHYDNTVIPGRWNNYHCWDITKGARDRQ